MKMIRLFYCLSFSTCLLYSCEQKHSDNAIVLSQYWKFHPSDSLIFADENYSDIGWDSLETGKSWDEQGYADYVGFAWYRNKVLLPSELKSNYNENDSLVINLGTINEAAEVYLNGESISSEKLVIDKYLSKPTETANGILPNTTKSVYKIGLSDPRIKWDKENLLAIRVRNIGGYGGLTSGVPFLYLSSKSDETSDNKLNISFNRFYNIIDQSEVDTMVVLKNNSTSEFSDLYVNISAINSATKKKVFSRRYNYNIIGLDSVLIPVSLPFSTDLTLVYLDIEDSQNRTLFKDIISVPFVLQGSRYVY